MTTNFMSQDQLTRLLASIDAKDTATFLGFLTEDAIFRFGSMPAVQGREAIRAAVDPFFASIDSCRHVLNNTVSDGATLLCEGDVTYRRHDGSELTLPFANVFELDHQLISHYKIYIDIGPLYAG